MIQWVNGWGSPTFHQRSIVKMNNDKWYYIVHTAVGVMTYVYGPFDTEREAWDWGTTNCKGYDNGRTTQIQTISV